jgi:hypothetical protein
VTAFTPKMSASRSGRACTSGSSSTSNGSTCACRRNSRKRDRFRLLRP